MVHVVDISLHSLTDDSTETFWESRDEQRGRPRTLTLSLEQECQVFAVVVHVDNQKDSGVRMIENLQTHTHTHTHTHSLLHAYTHSHSHTHTHTHISNVWIV